MRAMKLADERGARCLEGRMEMVGFTGASHTTDAHLGLLVASQCVASVQVLRLCNRRISLLGSARASGKQRFEGYGTWVSCDAEGER